MGSGNTTARGDVFHLVQHPQLGINFSQVCNLLRKFVGISPSYLIHTLRSTIAERYWLNPNKGEEYLLHKQVGRLTITTEDLDVAVWSYSPFTVLAWLSGDVSGF